MRFLRLTDEFQEPVTIDLNKVVLVKPATDDDGSAITVLELITGEKILVVEPYEQIDQMMGTAVL